MEPRYRFQGMNSASLCSLAGRYDNPIPTRCLDPIDFLKIPALYWVRRYAGSIDCILLYNVHCTYCIVQRGKDIIDIHMGSIYFAFDTELSCERLMMSGMKTRGKKYHGLPRHSYCIYCTVFYCKCVIYMVDIQY